MEAGGIQMRYEYPRVSCLLECDDLTFKPADTTESAVQSHQWAAEVFSESDVPCVVWSHVVTKRPYPFGVRFVRVKFKIKSHNFLIRDHCFKGGQSATAFDSP